MRRIAVRGIAMQDGTMLCVRLKPYNDLAASEGSKEWWCLPGGTVEEGEALEAAIEREIFEETAVRPEVGRLLYVQQFAHGGKEHLEMFFHIKNASDYRSVDLSKTSHGGAEIAEIGFVDPKVKIIKPTFLTTEPVPEHIAANAPAKFFSFL